MLKKEKKPYNHNIEILSNFSLSSFIEPWKITIYHPFCSTVTELEIMLLSHYLWKLETLGKALP